jgi:hypothetical protein
MSSGEDWRRTDRRRTSVGQRQDQRLIHPKRLAELEALAQEGRDVRAALRAIEPERMKAMALIREDAQSAAADLARAYLAYETDLGEALLAIVAKREGGGLP